LLFNEAIVVALIAASGTITAALIHKMRKENKNDHSMVVGALGRIETKIDGHIADHARGEFE
jgi:hypothetical protein